MNQSVESNVSNEFDDLKHGFLILSRLIFQQILSISQSVGMWPYHDNKTLENTSRF